jgi:subtilisin-like proprotein convertase family protein
MFWTKFGESSRKLVYSAVVVAVATVLLVVAIHRSSPIVNAAPTASFPGAGTGAIPDDASGVCHTSEGTPLNVTFNVSGITGSVTNVAVSFAGTHTWIGDLSVSLIAPNSTSHVIFARTGATAASGEIPESYGQGDDLQGGTYNFADSNTSPPSGGWWQEAFSGDENHVMTPGNYRTTASGGASAVSPAPATNMNAAFAGVTNANGTWTLRVTDGCSGDAGSVTAATLTIVGGGTFAADANVDMNGDGKTDWVVTRATNSPTFSGPSSNFSMDQRYDPTVKPKSPTRHMPPAGNSLTAAGLPIYWYVALNGVAGGGVGQLGDQETDTLTPEDFDGDGKDDLAVWTPGPPFSANFKILQSSTNTIRIDTFGQDGDVPQVVGDYDGDNKADPAVFRCPPIGSGGGQCYYFFRGSNNNPAGNITYVQWGFGEDGDFFPLIGDFDGDGKYDFCIQREIPFGSNQGQFVLYRSSDAQVEYINWGYFTDHIVPGDYDGDGKADFCVVRVDPSNHQIYYVLTKAGTIGQVTWGLGGDFLVPGDYDGDGKTDFAIWRPSADPAQNYFWILSSSNLSVSSFEWGQCITPATCDFPVATWAVY